VLVGAGKDDDITIAPSEAGGRPHIEAASRSMHARKVVVTRRYGSQLIIAHKLIVTLAFQGRGMGWVYL